MTTPDPHPAGTAAGPPASGPDADAGVPAEEVALLLAGVADLAAGGVPDPWPDADVTLPAGAVGVTGQNVLAAVADPAHPVHRGGAQEHLLYRPRLLAALGDPAARAWAQLWLLAEETAALEEDTGLALSEAVTAIEVVTGIEVMVAQLPQRSPAERDALFDGAVTALTTLVHAWAVALLEANVAPLPTKAVEPSQG